MISISHLGPCIDVEWRARNAPMIWGSPGIGKSAVIKSICSKGEYQIPLDDELAKASTKLAELFETTHHGRPVFDVRLSLMSPTDIKGIPVFDAASGDAVWIMSGVFPMDPTRLRSLRAKYLEMPVGHQRGQLEAKLMAGLHSQHGVIFLDELTQAPPSVQVSAFGLVLDRRVNDYIIPNGVDITAASNKMTDKSGTNKMPSALYSRFNHYTVSPPTVDQWIADFAGPAGTSLDIVAFLKGNPGLLYTFDSRNQTEDGSAGTYACPRTWEFLDRKLKAFAPITAAEAKLNGIGDEAAAEIERRTKKELSLTDDLFSVIVEAAVGPGVGTTFIGWRKAYRMMPPMEEYLEGKHQIEAMTRPIKKPDGTIDVGLVYAMTSNLLLALTSKHTDARVTRGLELFKDQHLDWKVVLWSRIIDKIRENPSNLAIRKLTDYEPLRVIAREIANSNSVGVTTGT